jgi:anthranilate 1,2-dioxygenase small subunit
MQDTPRGAITGSVRLPLELHWQLVEINQLYARCLDENRLDDWPNFFTDDAVYKIIPRENFDNDLHASLLFFDSNAMRRDRVLCIRDVNIYDIHVSRHFLGPVRIDRRGELFEMTLNFLVLHSDNEGRSALFATGEYRDLVVRGGRDEFLFREKIVILDTFNVPSQLAEPL